MKTKTARIVSAAFGLLFAATLFVHFSFTAAGASNHSEYSFDVSEGDVTIEKDTSTTLKVTYGSSQIKSGIPLTAAIGLVSQNQLGKTVSTGNIVIVDGTGISGNISLALNGIALKSTAPFTIKNSAKVTLTLQGANSVESTAPAGAAISLEGGSSLTIQGEDAGSLNVTAGSNYSVGIGSRLASNANGGNITLNSGTININVGAKSLGIGSVLLTGVSGSSGAVTINGGSISMQTGSNGFGIGTYMSDSSLTGTGGNVTIKGGTINVPGGIGTFINSSNLTAGKITVNGGSLNTILPTGQQAVNSASTKVNPYVLSTPQKSKTLTAAGIDGTAATANPASATGLVYGIKDIQSDSDGKLYFWLPATASASAVSVQLADNYYQNVFTRADNGGSAELYANAVVNFDLQGGKVGESETIDAVEVPYGETIPAGKRPTTPEKEKHTFGGWHTSSAFEENTAFSFTESAVTANLTLYARWLPVPVSSIAVTLDNSNLVLGQTETAKATATVTPQNAANTDITWSSANTEIAVIDDNGTITAKSPGSTNIIAT
ncbi:MAG: Ig domain-containing protein, partial [Oscillospiraceae bacterium]